jgi:ribosomal protein L29
MKDLLQKNASDLHKLSKEKRAELQTLKLQKISGTKDSSQFSKLRKEIARIETAKNVVTKSA